MESEKANDFFKKPQRPISIKFEDVVYKLKTKVTVQRGNGKNKSKTIERTILNKVSGVVKPGEMMALLGPSGSGKTTLITALCARLPGNLSGSITYNNKPFNASIKRGIGFVTQHDVHYPHLTVSETLRYTALLRLPDTLSRKEKVAKADEVIVNLGLVTCRDGIIGGERVRGVSGGERKRVSIGQELLVNPSLLFLDEPTSGLDSTTAQRIVSMLCDMARNGRTVMTTIHQPSTRIFYMFDKVMLLADGNQVYCGKGSEAMNYFQTIGYAPAMAMNPSDFLLDLANGVTSDGSETTSPAALKLSLFSAYSTTNKPLLMTEMREVSSSDVRDDHSKTDTHTHGDGWCTSWWEQFRTLLQRDLKERRHQSFSAMKLVQVSLATLIAGLLWFGSKNMQDQTGLVFFITTFWSLTTVSGAVLTFPLEREMLEKERSSGMYRLSSYFVAKMAGDIPMELILPTFSVTVMYWMGGLYPTAASYLETLSVVLLSALVAQGFGLAIGSLVMEVKTATTTSNVLMLTMMLCSGFFVKNVPVFMRWVKYLSFVYHAYRLNLISQFSMRSNLDPGVEFLMKITKGGPSSSVVALFLMLSAFRLVAYLGLRRIGVPKN